MNGNLLKLITREKWPVATHCIQKGDGRGGGGNSGARSGGVCLLLLLRSVILMLEASGEIAGGGRHVQTSLSWGTVRTCSCTVRYKEKHQVVHPAFKPWSCHWKLIPNKSAKVHLAHFIPLLTITEYLYKCAFVLRWPYKHCKPC